MVELRDRTWEKYTSFIGHLDKFNLKLSFDEIDVEMAARIRNYLTKCRLPRTSATRIRLTI
ncbi:phage integrase SAM-like domain-containing protein [Chitinophaga costaii]|uniref:phage integrase SAM-like domain-containing protein n=1 Tax=Chitinophaga costaii TaxID=1335309 RepID=UPI0013FE469B